MLTNLSTVSHLPITKVLHEIDKIRRHRIVIENDATLKIVFAVLLGVCLLGLCIAAVIFCYRKRSNRKGKNVDVEKSVAIELQPQKLTKTEPVLIGSLRNIMEAESML